MLPSSWQNSPSVNMIWAQSWKQNFKAKMTEKTVTSRGIEPCPVLSCHVQQYSTATLETGEFRHGFFLYTEFNQTNKKVRWRSFLNSCSLARAESYHMSNMTCAICVVLRLSFFVASETCNFLGFLASSICMLYCGAGGMFEIQSVMRARAGVGDSGPRVQPSAFGLRLRSRAWINDTAVMSMTDAILQTWLVRTAKWPPIRMLFWEGMICRSCPGMVYSISIMHTCRIQVYGQQDMIDNVFMLPAGVD